MKWSFSDLRDPIREKDLPKELAWKDLEVTQLELIDAVSIAVIVALVFEKKMTHKTARETMREMAIERLNKMNSVILEYGCKLEPKGKKWIAAPIFSEKYYV